MKKLLLPAFALAVSVLSAQAQYFTPGNLAVVRVGGSGQNVTSSDNGNPVNIDQYTTNGTYVNTLTLPTSGANSFVLDGSTTEGFLTLTPNGKYLILGGYNAPVGYTSNGAPYSIAGASSFSVPRSVGVVDGYGNFSLPIANTNIFSTYNIRGAVSDGLGNYWVAGSGGTGGTIANGEIGVVYVGTASSPTNITVSETGSGDERVLNLFNGALYVSTGSGSGTYGRGIYMISNVNGSLPTNTGSTLNNTNVMQTGASGGPYDFAINTAGTLAYVAEDSLGGIVKFTSTGAPGALWVSNYTIPVNQIVGTTNFTQTNAFGVTVDFSQSPAVIYATTGETVSNRLVRIVDNGASSAVTLMAISTANSTGSNYFRGVRFVPGAVPIITTQPNPLTVDAGQVASFSVIVTGTPTLTYQWYSNSVAVPLSTNATLTLNNTTTTESGALIYVAVSNAYGVADSTPVTLTVNPPGPPTNLVVTPSSQTLSAGATATFTVAVVGATPLTYGWTLNGAPLSDGGGISGSATASLTISNVLEADDGTYVALVTNNLGNAAASPATLSVIDPYISMEPMGETNLPGGSNVVLSVTATGTGPFTYQWLSNGVPISGATSSNYTVASSSSISQASYTVTVSNHLGMATTSTATTVAYTPLLINETFTYPNGNLFTESPWTDINGTSPELVINDRVQIAQTNATTDAQLLFASGETVSNGSGTEVVWVSFIINLSTLPTNAGGTYFANIEDTNFDFYGRVFTLTSNNPSFTPNISPVAYPGTYRLGISDAQTDFSGKSTTGPTAVVPLDLAPGIDYQVVYFVDLVNGYSAMAVNPASISDVQAISSGGVSSGAATDPLGSVTNAIAAYGLRQRQGEGIMQMDNLEVSYDWNGANSGYPVVTGGITTNTPVIGLQPAGTTNYLGNPYVLEVAASGIGTAGTGLSYQWYQNGFAMSDGGSVTGSATPSLTLNPLVATNSGTYYVVVEGANHVPVQSSNAVVSIITTPTAPIFTVQPVSTTNSEGGSASFTAAATGTGPITYEWYFNGAANGVTTPTLTLSSLATNQSGTYYVIATGGTGLMTQSSNAVLTVMGPQSVTIGYLRGLLNTTTFVPNNETTLFNVTGVITTSTNLTSGDTGSYYLQDATGGINLFVTDGSDFRPMLGDIVTATGTLSSYDDNLELDVTEGAAGFVDTILGTNGVLPTPIVIPWGYNPGPLSPSVTTNVEGSVVMITNLYFEAASYTPGVTNYFASGTYIITNTSLQTYSVYLSDQDTNNVVGQPIPQYAASIAGPLIQDDTAIGIEFTVYSNLVLSVTPPTTYPPVTNLMASVSGTNFVLTWTAIPADDYTVLYSTNVAGPYAHLSSGLTFSTTMGSYTDILRTNPANFYAVTNGPLSP